MEINSRDNLNIGGIPGSDMNVGSEKLAPEEKLRTVADVKAQLEDKPTDFKSGVRDAVSLTEQKSILLTPLGAPAGTLSNLPKLGDAGNQIIMALGMLYVANKTNNNE